MGVFDRVEKKLESAVSGVFARAFKGDVQPVEITARLQRELDAETRLLSRDRKLVPNDFRIGLSQHDYDRLAPYSKTLNSEIIPQLRSYAAEAGYIFNGPVTIDYHLDTTLPVGRFSVTSSAVAGVDSSVDEQSAPVAPVDSAFTAAAGAPLNAPDAFVAPTPQPPASLVVEVNGVRHPLTPPGVTIGRGTDAELRINDPGVSRVHARINVVETGTGQVLDIEDLGSTNGIVVDGQRTRKATLTLGSKIEIGSTRLAIVSPVNDV